MSYEQYSQLETQVLEIPYEQKLQLLYIIADSLKNTAMSKKNNLKDKKPKRRLGILKGKIWMTPDFDDTPPCFEEYMLGMKL
ncbi:DUF2281 domain-containing protein [Treponema sp. OMZ 792]|uniref:DUF2281 domain-containing protein n=1 Tax=unclassified Treponema TaxID=2638727 RepID=UPI0020A41667|nr:MULTISPECIES: DUF2281 domain-containing protein [unclassified Treponema]UTC74383.1 DUF2281 domain-containing protein [Treponema sp. OMZ 792]UTC77341.1 DUF2281 domain-containing protein [Treponema sp. OMZ 799]UTC80780.1 DUF2281 domain-containing protein [Treponema sp. OMZ 798]